MDAAMSAAGRSRPGSRRTSMLGGATPSMRPVGRDTPRSRLHNQLNTPGLFDSAPIIPDFDLVGPKSSWDGESVATTRAGSTRPPPHPHTTPRHAMQATVEDAPPSGFTSARPSPLHSGAIMESKRNSDMETVQEEPVAGPSTFPHVVLSVDPPEGDPSRSRPSSRRAGSSGRTRDEQLHQDSGWDDFDTHAPATSGWGDFGGGDGWPGGFNVGGHAGGSGWPDEPPPLASGLGLSGATASQQGSRRPSDASLYVQDPIQPQTPARSRAHSRAPSGSGLSQMARSPPGGTAPLLAPPQVRSPTLSDVHGANMFHVPVAGSPPLGSPSQQVASPPRPQQIRTNITPTRSNATPSRSVRPTPIARDYALPEGHRNIPLAADGTPRFPQHKIPVPAGVSTPGRALRDAMFMGNGTPRHPAAARQAQPEPEPEPEPEPPQEPPQEDEPAVPGKKSFLSRVSSMLNRDRNIQKDKPPAPRKVKKKKGKGAVEEMLAEEWAPEAGPSTLGDAPPPAEHDPADEERKRAEEEEARKKAEDERRRKEEAEEALKAAEEVARLESERRRQEEEERRLRDEEEERLARERAEAVEAEHAQVLSQHGDAPPPDPPAAAVEEQADKGEGGGGGWGLFKRRGTKKKKGAQKPPTPPPPEPSPFNLPPLPTDAAPADAPPPHGPVPPSPQRTFAAPPRPIRTYQQSPRPTLDTTVHGHAPTLIEFSGAPHEEQREYVYVPSNATPTPGHHRGASTIHAVPAPATRRSPTHVYAGTAATQTPRLPSTYTMPFPHSHGPGRSPLPRVASGASGAMAFRVPPRSPTGTATAPATPSVPSAQLLAEHAKVLGALEGAEAARDRAFLQNEERRARLFDEAEDRRRQEAEARRRVIEVWV